MQSIAGSYSPMKPIRTPQHSSVAASVEVAGFLVMGLSAAVMVTLTGFALACLFG